MGEMKLDARVKMKKEQDLHIIGDKVSLLYIIRALIFMWNKHILYEIDSFLEYIKTNLLNHKGSAAKMYNMFYYLIKMINNIRQTSISEQKQLNCQFESGSSP